MKRGSRRTVLAAIGAMTALWGLSVGLTGRQVDPEPRPLMAEDIFTNLQVLRGIPVDEFMGTMGFFSAALGMTCTDCHVEESGGSWERYADDNELKQTSRMMVLMVNAINRANFGGEQVVTCFTCHRGESPPAVMPSLTMLYSVHELEEPGAPFQQAPGQPAAGEIFDRYLEALGGAQQVSALNSFIARGNYEGFGTHWEDTPVEVFAEAPGRRATYVRTSLGDITTVYDGQSGWTAAPETDQPVPVLGLTGQELDIVALEAALSFPASIQQALSDWRVGFPNFIDDREVEVVQGTTPEGGTATLCFDAESGFLVRVVHVADSPVGPLVKQIDYEDYREVAGVKLPFRWTVTWLSGRSTFELSEIEPNASIDAARFARPATP